MQCGQRTCWGDFEGRAIAVRSARVSCPVEVPVGSLNQPYPQRVFAVSVVEAVQRGQRARWGDFEDRATAISTGGRPAISGCPLEVPVGALDQPCRRVFAVSSVEDVQRGEGLCRRGNCRRRTNHKDGARHFQYAKFFHLAPFPASRSRRSNPVQKKCERSRL